MSDIVTVQGLVKKFDDLVAVDHIDFSIAEGEIFGLLGPNGAGKTTTISMISGLLDATEGDVIVDGHSVRKKPGAVKQVLGVVPQEVALYPTLTARENLAFWGRMYGLGGKELSSAVDEALELAGLADRAKERIEKYSGGMKRRINIAAGILHKPRVLLMDEPTVGIDPQSRNHILEQVKELNTAGMTVLYTSHYMEEVEFLCDRVGIMDHGKVIAMGTIDELRKVVGDADIVAVELDEALADGALESIRALDVVTEAEATDSSLQVLSVGRRGGALEHRHGAQRRGRSRARYRGHRAQPRIGVLAPYRQVAAGLRSMPKFLTVTLKDLRVLTRDVAALGVLLGMPMILILILGSAFGGLAGEAGFDARVAIVNLDSGVGRRRGLGSGCRHRRGCRDRIWPDRQRDGQRHLRHRGAR